MRFWVRILFTGAVVIVFAYALSQGLRFSPVVRPYTMVVAASGLVLGLSLFVVDMRSRQKLNKVDSAGLVDIAPSEDIPIEVALKKGGIIFAFLLGWYLLIWLVGFKIAAIIVSFAFMKVQGKLGWIPSIVITGASAYVILFLGESFLQVTWPASVLQSLVNLPRFLY